MLIGMRNTATKIVTFILFALLILSFAVWGIGDIFRGGTQTAAVAEVGGAEIGQQEFSSRLLREVGNLRQRFGGEFDVAQAQAFGIVDQVLQQLVTRTLFDEQAAKLGMAVSETQIKDRIRNEEVFKNALGDFDRVRFFQILQSNNITEREFIESLVRDIKRQQIVDAVTGATVAPLALAKALYVHQQEQRVAETIAVAQSDPAQLPAPTEAELKATYEEHANRFLAPEYRNVTLIHLRAEDLLAENQVSADELRNEFEARREEFRVPEKRQVEQMVFADEVEAKDAKTRLDGGEDFAEVSRSALGREPVGLGEITRADLDEQLPELADTVFGLAEGGVGGPVESPLGWHILRVNDIEPGLEPDFDAVREELAEDMAMRAAIDVMVDLANDLDDELGSGASLEEAADVLRLKTREIAAVDASGTDPDGEPVADLPTGPEFSQVVFQTAAGDNSLLTETRDGNYFVVRVNSVTAAATRPFEEVREDLVNLWRDLESDRLTRERAERLAQRARDGESLAKIAESEGLKVTVTEPVTRRQTESAGLPSRELVSKLFEIGPGEVAVGAAPAGYLVAKLTEVLPADPGADPDAVARIRDGLTSSLQGDILTGFVGTLREQIGVSINNRAVQLTLERAQSTSGL